ncbi:MAG: response regulator [Planctomycetes bacterium]|nr:response regulator [Planctomycetota bacterium]
MNRPILLVDDDETNLAILEEILRDVYPLILARDGEEALAMYRQHKPPLVLLDIMMPKMNGYDVCRAIKQQDKARFTQVILLSAKASMEERVRGYEAGADDYLTKPFEEEELKAKVRVHLRLCEALMELNDARARTELDNGKLEQLVRRRTNELIETRDLVVFGLAKLADSRDPETGDHLERIRAYCRILSEHLAQHGPFAGQITDAFIHTIYLSSPLHDIGKVGIPDAILLKPGRLTDSEFDIMKRHAAIGAEALQDVAQHGTCGGFLQMAIDIARSHHERFDGTGYPDGLSGGAIPLSARIVAVADVFDALTSVRVYKSAYSTEVARTMIINESGKHFDPTVVEAFIACYDQLLETRRSYNSDAAGSAAMVS